MIQIVNANLWLWDFEQPNNIKRLHQPISGKVDSTFVLTEKRMRDWKPFFTLMGVEHYLPQLLDPDLKFPQVFGSSGTIRLDNPIGDRDAIRCTVMFIIGRDVLAVERYGDWDFWGEWYGFPTCCVEAFNRLDHIGGSSLQLEGTGYIPCAQCNASKTEQELREAIAAKRLAPYKFPHSAATPKSALALCKHIAAKEAITLPGY